MYKWTSVSYVRSMAEQRRVDAMCILRGHLGI